MGILEQLLAAIQENTAAHKAGGGNPRLDAQPAAGALTAAATPQAAPATVTADSITALIQPHIANEAIKTALGGAMRGMGINALPETQPHQYPALYAAFQQIIAQHTSGGAAANPAASASII